MSKFHKYTTTFRPKIKCETLIGLERMLGFQSLNNSGHGVENNCKCQFTLGYFRKFPSELRKFAIKIGIFEKYASALKHQCRLKILKFSALFHKDHGATFTVFFEGWEEAKILKMGVVHFSGLPLSPTLANSQMD